MRVNFSMLFFQFKTCKLLYSSLTISNIYKLFNKSIMKLIGRTLRSVSVACFTSLNDDEVLCSQIFVIFVGSHAKTYFENNNQILSLTSYCAYIEICCPPIKAPGSIACSSLEFFSRGELFNCTNGLSVYLCPCSFLWVCELNKPRSLISNDQVYLIVTVSLLLTQRSRV